MEVDLAALPPAPHCFSPTAHIKSTGINHRVMASLITMWEGDQIWGSDLITQKALELVEVFKYTGTITKTITRQY